MTKKRKMMELPTAPVTEGVTLAQWLSSPAIRFDMNLPIVKATPPGGNQPTAAVVKIPCYPPGLVALSDTAELITQAEEYLGISSFDMEGIDLDELYEFLFTNDVHDWFK